MIKVVSKILILSALGIARDIISGIARDIISGIAITPNVSRAETRIISNYHFQVFFYLWFNGGLLLKSYVSHKSGPDLPHVCESDCKISLHIFNDCNLVYYMLK